MRPLLVGLAVLCFIVTHAQAPADQAFEVASVKPTDQPLQGFTSSPDRFLSRSTTLLRLILYAYEVDDFQVQGGPGWVRNALFAVEAKASGEPTAQQMRRMVRRLLAERFGLKMHVETKDLPRYSLVKARDDGRLGEKLRPSAVDCPAVIATRGPDYTPPPADPKTFGRLPQPGALPRCAVTARMTGDSVTVVHEGTPMSEFARFIQTRAGRVVVDKTGLTGTYDIEFETERGSPAGPPVQSGPAATPREGLSLFTAVQEQLGLKLEAERGPVQVLVIDHVEPPTPD